MSDISKQTTQADAWSSLRSFTAARIALGRTGVAIPLKESLQFTLAHAHARDAVYSLLNIETLINELQQFNIPILHLHSNAKDRYQYLQRPDYGRKLNAASLDYLKEFTNNQYDIAISLADGLSATAVNQHIIELLTELIPVLQRADFSIAPFCLTEQARVAISDEIASSLNAKLSLIFIGERPGLSSQDSLGAYLTYNPIIG
ncbi:MAG: ethanolamine ammonia-lyase subunit EutC [Ferruginibacter sp.]